MGWSPFMCVVNGVPRPHSPCRWLLQTGQESPSVEVALDIHAWN